MRALLSLWRERDLWMGMLPMLATLYYCILSLKFVHTFRNKKSRPTTGNYKNERYKSCMYTLWTLMCVVSVIVFISCPSTETIRSHRRRGGGASSIHQWHSQITNSRARFILFSKVIRRIEESFETTVAEIIVVSACGHETQNNIPN